MSFIELKKITKRFGSVTAVHDLSLRVEKGEFVTLLGPSGCGKTTVLRMIAGLENPDEGEIQIGGETVFSWEKGIVVPSGNRNLGLVFQSYALWPHMTVFDNVAFGLQVHKSSRKDIRKRVHEALEYLQMEDLESRYPQEMSGGQQQRVALARMLVMRPEIFLMDEPLSNLDAKLRMEMRFEIKRLHRETGATTIYVTHDQMEAMTMATRIAVMRNGIIQQVDTPVHIYDHPNNLFVADFIGTPTINFLPARITSQNWVPVLEVAPFQISGRFPEKLASRDMVAAVRPEDIEITEPGPGAVAFEVYTLLPAGSELIIQACLEKTVLNIKETKSLSLKVGDTVYLILPPKAINLYDRETEELLTWQ